MSSEQLNGLWVIILIISLVCLPYTQCTPYTTRLNAIYGEGAPYTAIVGLLRFSAQRPLAVHKNLIHHTVARSSKKVL